jgi:dipeptidase D
MATTSPLDPLLPRPVWAAFDAIRRIPRPSRREEKIVAEVRRWAAEHGFPVTADAAGNLLVRVPASPGREGAPVVVLQSHLDMVTEKNRGVEHDFDRDPIEVYLDGDWVKARGTTLGADNGIGAALGMAAATDPDFDHGPLELLFTLDEETGLNGALQLDPALVGGRLLLNLDSEDEGIVYIGCAGAIAVEATFELEREKAAAGGEIFELMISGLRGGHSGTEIHTHRGNANKILARLLAAAVEGGSSQPGADLGLVAFTGGDKPNAIPREAFAEILLSPESKAILEATIAKLLPLQREELADYDPGLEARLRPLPAGERQGWPAMTAMQRDRLLRAIDAAPAGVLAMSPEMPGLVETSANTAVVRTEEGRSVVLVGIRSSRNPTLDAAAQSLESLFRLAGGQTRRTRGYPGWLPNPSAPLLARILRVYEEQTGAKMTIQAVHAGLECGVLARKLDGLDAVSFGPDIRGAHSPDERVSVPSVARTYELLKALLGDLAARPKNG